ncbi:MAG: AAA family ATPase [Candidatus Omnitrophota bacterium]|nr:AAA family ATPase [Candidatus Omnitrophota bacterium]
MFLKELEIFGFKSFPEKTSLRFEPGITVIVGPNGCGKSNLLDALRWSLGEQSPKSLRGSKMEDIIFNGTENHPPLSYAEVTLTFDNEDGYLPIEYKEVAVSRRLYRSGESEYLINKNIVRLKDVEHLFMGTGIGEATYSFIEQGKIEIFLSYKPEDKRLIFDEASGIVKYKESRRETLRKLEETDENLLRLEDIISEVKRQIRYLERQVEKTRKFKEGQEKLIEVEKKIAALNFSELEKKLNIILEELNTFKIDETNKEKELTVGKEVWEKINCSLKVIRQKLQEVSSQVFSLSAQIETCASHIDINGQRIKELSERSEIIEQSKNTLGERLTLQEKRLEEERNNFNRIENEANSIEAQIIRFEVENGGLEKAIAEAKKNIEAEKIKILEGESNGITLRNSLVEIQTNVTAVTNRKKRLLLDKARLEGFLSEKKNALELIHKELESLEKAVNAIRDKKNSLALKEQELAALKEDLQRAFIDKEKEYVEFNSYHEFLKDLRTKYDTFSATRKITIAFDEEPKNINKIIVSLKGIEFQKDGNMYKAALEAKVISLEEEQLQVKINIVNHEIGELRKKIEEVKAQMQHLGQESAIEINQLSQEEKKLQKFIQEKENANREWARFTEEFELVEKELGLSMKELQDYETKQKELEVVAASVEESLNSTKLDLQRFQDVIAKSTARSNEINIEIAKQQTHKQSLAREKEGLNSKIGILHEERDNTLKSLKDFDKEKEDNIVRSKILSAEIQKLELSIKDDKEKITEYSKTKEALEKQDVELGVNIEQERSKLDLVEKELEEVRLAVYNKKLEIQGLDYEKGKIKDYLLQVYHIEFDVSARGQIEYKQEELDNLSQEKENLKKKIESLGEVNLVAIEEFDELKKREEFLDRQKNDLITSKENLKKAIQKINKTSKELFLETFAKIEEEFKNNFRFLFGGGRAQLMLLDQENILDSGVEIEVQPPGKKLQNVALLSGGEKALTTIALIFAIFKVRPSPISVLDEIDAPLDEANVDRFNHILKEFAAHSQFIVITHNKKTMSRADILYGVTMQEKGVSKLVSVKFGDQNGEPKNSAQEPAPAQ